MIILILIPTIAILIDALPIMVDTHVVSEFVRHDQSTAAQASGLRYCARRLIFRGSEMIA